MINCSELPYQEGYYYYKRLYACYAPVLLDSNRRDRYDIVSAEPTKLLSQQQGRFILHDRISREEHVQSKVLTDIIESTLPQIDGFEHLPFVGGWIGLLSYDFARQLETLPDRIVNDTNIPDIWFGYYDWVVVSDHEKQKSFLLYDDALAESEQFQTFMSALDTSLEEEPPHFSVTTDFHSSFTKEGYIENFAKIKQYITDGHIYQTNYSQRFSAEYEGDPIVAYERLRTKNPAPFAAMMRLENDHWITSCSPERFVKIEGDDVITNPIKGTRPRDADPTIDKQNAIELQNSKKDQAENLMIVDLLRNDLSKNCVPGSVKVPHLFECHSFKNVHHLISTITAKLDPSCSPFKLILDAFPGGSVTGAPKLRAMEISEELEPVRRALFCGSILYYSKHRKFDSNIVIRTAVFDSNKLYLWAGGGIVHDSTAEDEYQETFDKVNIILDNLRQAGQNEID